MRLRGRNIALLLIGAYALLGAITAWSDDPNADTPPIMAFMMMAMGFVFLGVYFIVMFVKHFSGPEHPLGFPTVPLQPPGEV